MKSLVIILVLIACLQVFACDEEKLNPADVILENYDCKVSGAEYKLCLFKALGRNGREYFHFGLKGANNKNISIVKWIDEHNNSHQKFFENDYMIKLLRINGLKGKELEIDRVEYNKLDAKLSFNREIHNGISRINVLQKELFCKN